jgi:hypothetical protein
MELSKDALKLKRKLEKIKKKRVIDEMNGDNVGVSVDVSVGPTQNEQAAHNNHSVSKEEILSEYFQFLRNLPILPDLELNKVINTVKSEWGIDEILKSQLEPIALLHLSKGNLIADKLSTKMGQSLRIISPPVKDCLLCKESLSVSNYPTQIVVHTLTGPAMYSKYILKCQRCRLIEKSKFNPLHENRRQDIFYHPDKYGNMSNGYMFYKQDIPYVKATNEVYLDRSLVESDMSNFMHGFMSMESAAEAYNETFRHSTAVTQLKEFIDKNPSVGNHFNAKVRETKVGDYVDVPLSDDFNEKEAEEKGRSIQNGMHELNRKSVVSSFYNCWIPEEMKERNMNFMFGPYYKEEDGGKVVVTFKDSVEDFIEQIDNLRSREIYKHENCAGS